jgi:autotransporter translocation and assembly factor TamB
MPEKAKRRRWPKYLLAGLLAVLALTIALYQPIFFAVAQVVAQQFAKSQELSLRFKIHGSIFSDLYIEDLHLRPLPENTTLPLENIDAQRVALRYNLFSLLKKDFLSVVELVELDDISIVVRPAPPAQQTQPSPRMPVIIPKKIDVQNFNLTVRGEHGDLELRKFALAFQQGEEGYLACESLRIPALGTWHQLRAGLRYNQGQNQGQLELSDFALAPIVAVNRLQVDLSGSEQGRFRLALDAKVLESAFAANVTYEQPANTPFLNATLKLTGLELNQIQKLSPIPISGSISRIDVHLDGNLNRPSSFSGSISVAANGVRYQDYDIDTANVALITDKGRGKIQELSVNAGPNKLRASGNFTLPETPNELLSGSSADIGFAGEVRGSERYIPDLHATTLATGSIGLANGRAQLVLRASVGSVRTPKLLPGLAIAGIKTDLFAVAQLPLAEDPWKSLAAVVISNVTKISYQDAHIGQVQVVADTIDTKTATANLSLESGESRAEVAANLPLPSPGISIDPKQIAGHLRFNIASINDFLSQHEIAGNLTANGDIQFDHLQANGAVRANGQQLKYRGIILQSLDVDANFKDQLALVRNLRINFDPADYIDLTGSAQLADPFPFQAHGQVKFKDVAVLNEFLRDLGLTPGLSGSVNVNFSGTGNSRNPAAQLQVSGNQLQYRGFVVQGVDVAAIVTHGAADLQRCRVSLDPNNYVDISGNIQFADPNPYQARGRIKFQDLGLFNPLLKSLGQPQGLSGALNVDFSGTGNSKNIAAGLQVQGEKLKYRGLLIQNINAEATVENSKADVQRCRVTLDPNNRIELTGTAQLADPYAYVLNGRIELTELGVFDELLKNLGQPAGLSGIINGTFSSNGDAKHPEAHIRFSGYQLKYLGLLIPTVGIETAVEGGKADFKTCRVTINQNDFVDVTGNVGLVPPYLYDARGAITLRDLGVFDELLKNVGQPANLSGSLSVDFSGKGDTKNPTAHLHVLGDGLKYRGLLVQSVDLESKVENSLATIEAGRVSLDADNYLDISGNVDIVEPNPYEAHGTTALKNLGVFNEFLRSLGQPGDLAGSLEVDLSGTGTIQNPTAEFRARGNQLKYRGLPIQSIDLQSKVQNRVANIESCRINLDADNYINLTAEVELSDPYAYKTNGAIELRNLAMFSGLLKSIGQSPAVSGNVHVDWSGNGNARGAIPDAQLHLLAGQLKYRGLLIQSIDIDGSLLKRKLDLPNCKIIFNQDNFINARGDALLEEPYNYDAYATIQFQELGFLNELTKSFGQDLDLGGKLNASWTGKGPLQVQTGNLELHGDQIRTKAVQRVKFDVAANYQGMKAEVPRLQIFSPYADLDASMRISPQLLEIPTLNISKSGTRITGNVKVPLKLQPGEKVPVDLDQPIDINIQADKIALSSFQPAKPQVAGTIAFRLQASQTLRNPLLQFTASARDVRATAVSNLSAAKGDLSIRVADKVLTVDGQIQQQDVHPLQLTGRIPLDVGQIIETGNLPSDTPLQFALKWPDNNLSFIRKIVPEIKVAEGTTSVDVGINGTIKRPDLTGSIRASLSRLQANSDMVPPIADFSATITFRRDHVQFDQLKGLAGGGLFGINGAIDLTDGTNPKLDLGVTGNQVLLTRSDGIIVRANFALAIRGPLSSGEISGTVGITDSRFFKDIDILPLNLPGRPPPQPPPSAMPKIAVDIPPFKDWKFNISIRTDDPFLVQSNLARGRVTVNLQAGGTGAAPSVTGFVQVDRLVASLPFSKMEIDNGRIDFAQGGNILDPTLSILGRSTVSDYEVRMRIFGHVSNPTVLLDSSPPLAQGDILVLLATGSTTAQFEQNPSLLAGRASFLVLQQLYKKVFPSKNRAPEQKEPFIDRFSVNVGPGSRAGEQSIVSTFTLTKNWQIIGVFGTSSYQGRLKYLVRFR